MYRVEIKVIGMKDIEEHLDKVLKKSISHLKKLGIDAQQYMREYIESNRKREKEPTNKPHLSELIDSKVIMDNKEYLEIGIGDVEYIESKHVNPDYNDTGQGWKLLNWGGKVPAGGKFVRGEFTDGVAKPEGGKARFIYDPSSKHGMIPKKIVEGIHFIEKTAIYILNKLRSFKIT